MSQLSPEKCMALLMNNYVGPSIIVPDPDKYYVFVYKAKTPRIQYDQHPLIVCTGVYQWGFTGYNFHWEDTRRYSWGEVLSNLIEIGSDELNEVEQMPIQKYRST